MKAILFGFVLSLGLGGYAHAEGQTNVQSDEQVMQQSYDAQDMMTPVDAQHYDLENGLFLDDGTPFDAAYLARPGHPGGGHPGHPGGGHAGPGHPGHPGHWGPGHHGGWGRGWHPGGGRYFHHPGWRAGWRWNWAFHPRWWAAGLVFPLFFWEVGVPATYWQCIAFNQGGENATPYLGFAPDKEEAAYNAVMTCGGEANCYIPNGYCQMR